MIPSETESYDAVIVGARVAGAATALLLAQGGRRVLVLDRGEPATDTLSTHALTRAGVLLLDRMGVLDELIDQGTPPVRRTTFHYGSERVVLDVDSKDGVDWLLAPRRTVLDPVLVGAARAAGADVRHRCRVTGLVTEAGDAKLDHVAGVRFTDHSGKEREVRADVTVGADGTRSLVARSVGAPTLWEGTHAGAMLYGHFQDPGVDGYHWFYDVGATAGVIPTNDGLVCAWVGAPAERYMAELRGDPAATFALLLREAAPEFVGVLDIDQPETRIHGHPGRVGYLLQPCGPGWALVGDASYFKDPLTAHGITDALRDAKLLAEAILGVRTIGPLVAASYAEAREQPSIEFSEVTDAIASYRWGLAEIKSLIRAEGKLLADEAHLFATRDT